MNRTSLPGRILQLVPILLLAVGCAGSLPMATPTAIPLEATATRRPSVTPLPTPTVPAGTRTPARTPTSTDSGQPSALDRTLARQTVDGFLSRLLAGDERAAYDLYLSDRARATHGSLVLEQWARSDLRLARAEVRTLDPYSTGFQARVELRWEVTDQGQVSTQTLILELRSIHGLWLIDDVTLDEPTPPESIPYPTTAPPSPARRPTNPTGRLVFQATSGGPVYRINADGTDLLQLATGLDPAWSPDGQHIAYTRWAIPWGLYITDANGITMAGQTIPGQRLKSPAWDPTRRRLVVARDEGATPAEEVCIGPICFTIPPKGKGSLWLVDVEARSLERLPVPDQAPQSPTWSPDGERIVYTGDAGLAWVAPDGSARGTFLGHVSDRSAAYAPDGSRIVFMSYQHDHWDLFVMDANGARRRLLTSGSPPEANNVAPAWSPDGRQIAFLSDRDGPWRIYLVDAAGGGQARSMFGTRLDSLGLRYDYAAERVLCWTQ
jgi:hypothetical protein